MTDGTVRSCQRCGYSAVTAGSYCRRCGLPYGANPAVIGDDGPPECPVCYARGDRGGLYPAPGGGRTTYERHARDHELRPVGDDDWLETLRDGDEIVIDRWRAPFALTRRYLVTGQWDAGKGRTYVHNAVIIAMVGATRGGEAIEPTPPPAPPAPSDATTHRRFAFLHRPGARKDARAAPDDIAAARRAVDAVRERYLARSRR